jgi:hypothetical protein
MTTFNMDEILKKAEEGGDFYQPEPGEYDVEIVRFLDKDPGIISAFFKVLSGPEAGKEFLQTFGMWRKSDQQSQWGFLNPQRWMAAGVPKEYLAQVMSEDGAATCSAVKQALLGTKLHITIATQKKNPEYVEISLNKIKVIERPALPNAAAAVAGVPATAPAGVPTGLPTVPTATAPETAPAAAPAPSAAPAAAPAGVAVAEVDPQVAALQAQLAALQAQQAAQSSPNGGPAPAVEEDPGF